MAPKFLTPLLLSCAFALSAAELVYKPALDKKPREVRTSGKVTFANGKLAFFGANNFATAAFEKDTVGDTDISFKFTPVKKGAKNKDGHFGADLSFADGTAIKLYYFGGRWLILSSKPGAKSRGAELMAVDVPNNKTGTVKIALRKTGLTLTCEQKTSKEYKLKLEEFVGLSFYAYNWDWVLQDFVIRSQTPKTAERPVTTVYVPDFKTLPAGAKRYGNIKTESGKLKISGYRSMASVSVPLAKQIPCDGVLTFNLTPFRRNIGTKDGHYGFTLTFNNGSSAMLYSRGGAWILQRNKPGRRIPELVIVKMPNIPLAKPAAIKLIFNKKSLVFSCNNAMSLEQEVDFDSLKNISFYGYNWDTEISNLKIGTLGKAPEEKAPAKKIVLDGFKNGSMRGKVAKLPGICGEAIKIPKNGNATFILNEKLFKSGTVLVWVRRDVPSTFYHIIEGKAANGRTTTFSTHFDAVGLNTLLCRANGMRTESARRWNRGSSNDGDWYLYGLSVDEKGFVIINYNSLSFYGAINGSWWPRSYSNLNFKDLRRIVLGANNTFSGLRVYNYAMTAEEMSKEFIKVIPIDLRMENTVVAPGKTTELVFQVAPAGTFMTPSFKIEPVQKPVKLSVELTSVDGKTVVAKKDYTLDVKNNTLTCKLPALSLKQDDCLKARFYVNGFPVFTKAIHAWSIRPAQKATTADFKKGKLIFEQPLTNQNAPELIRKGIVTTRKGYLECGNNKYNCIAFKVPFPKDSNGTKPYLIEIDWPDDKPRNMGLYLYKPTKSKTLRDCLQGGVASGNEYPNSGKIQTVRHLFYPTFPSYLFEARTLSTNYPAAIAGFRVYEIDGPLPKLAINYPDGLPHRRLGHQDEDQTFDYLFDHNFGGRGMYSNKVQDMTNLFLDYMDYNGQELFVYPLLRYGSTQYPETGVDQWGLYPYNAELNQFMVSAMAARGKEFIAISNLYRLPEFDRHTWLAKEREAKGMTRMTAFGEVEGQNMNHPEIRKMYLKHVRRVLEQNAKVPGFKGLNVWQFYYFTREKTNNIPAKYYDHFDAKADRKENPVTGVSSYDDYSIALYRKEADPKMPDFKGDTRFMKRFEYLVKPENEAKWDAWNTKKIVEVYRELRKLLDEFDPKLILAIAGNPYEFPDLSKERIIIYNSVGPTSFRWSLQYSDSITTADEKQFNFTDGKRHIPFIGHGHNYFETFADSPHPDYASYFQNADMKAPGRYALRAFAFSLARFDSFRFTWGDQPMASMGREAETREFTRAFSALPALPFKSVKGVSDPVTVRYLNTKNGCYVYCVSLVFTDCTVALKGAGKLTDLSDGSTVDASKIVLKPYQLRSFLIKPGLFRKNYEITGADVMLPKQFFDFYQKEFKAAEEGIAVLKGLGIKTADAEKSLAKAKQLYAEKRYAVAHTELFSAAWHRAKKMINEAKNLKIVRDMLKQRTLRVNCGSSAFMKTRDGRIFVPDAAYKEGRGYGYTGREVLFCTRDITGVNYKDKEVFLTEVYNLETYQVNLPRGTYNVKLLLRWGFGPSFKNVSRAETLKVRLGIGKDIRKIDFYEEMKHDMKNYLVYEFKNVKVTDGLLKIDFYPLQKGRNQCLLNAIEITPAR